MWRVIELMPPAVKTDMTADLPEGDGITLITTERDGEAVLQGSESRFP